MTTLDPEERFTAALLLDAATLILYMFNSFPFIGEPLAVFLTAPLFAISIGYAAWLFWGDRTVRGAQMAERAVRGTVGRLMSMAAWKLLLFVAITGIIGWILASFLASFAWIPVATLALAVVERGRIVEMVTSR